MNCKNCHPCASRDDNLSKGRSRSEPIGTLPEPMLQRMADLGEVHAGEAHAVEGARVGGEIVAGHDASACGSRRRSPASVPRRRQPSALIGISPTGTSSAMYLWSQDFGVPVAWYGPSLLVVSSRQVSPEIGAAYAVDALEPVLEIRHRRTERGGDRDSLGVDCPVEASDGGRHPLGVEFVCLAPVDPTGIADAVRDMQHRIRVHETGRDDRRRRHRLGEQRRQPGEHRSDAIAGKCRDLQPALADDRSDATGPSRQQEYG